LVAAELGRRGWIATTFTGSLPGFDILAVNEQGRILEVQVKAIQSSTWQLNAGQFLEIELVDGVQYIRGPKAIQTAGRICIFVRLIAHGRDEFYLFRWQNLQELLARTYVAGRRPKNPTTRHHALLPKHIEQYKDNWDVLNAEAGAGGAEASARE
jgi:hypothetical protein